MSNFSIDLVKIARTQLIHTLKVRIGNVTFLKLLRINAWIQHTESVLPLKHEGETHDILAVSLLDWMAHCADGVEFALTPGEIDEACEMTQDYLAIRRLPDRRKLMVMPLFWGYANLGISPKPPLENAGAFYDSWQFPTHQAALAAFRTWNPEESPEPEGWDRHVNSGRRRPGGDKSKEYVKE